jgi:diguanylate cyclase
VRFPISSGGDLAVTISIGVTSLRKDTVDPAMLLSEADQALYASKEGGRNRVSVFTPPVPG